MPAQPPRPPSPDSPPLVLTPGLPTLVSCSFKGGSWKTSVAVACAERLAYAGKRVLLLSADPQRDARQRLGIKGSQHGVISVERDKGRITVATATNELVLSVLYGDGFKAPEFEKPDLIIVDMPPTEQGVRLPGTFMIMPLVDQNAMINAAKIIASSPANSSVVLLRVGDKDAETWETNAAAIEKSSGRPVCWIAEPIPSAEPVKEAHAEGRSIWTLPRRNNTKKFQDGIEHVCELFWADHYKNKNLPAMPPIQVRDTYVPGWSRD